ncbi:hypothetical protein [Cohnella fermenti]|uniref:Hsp20/alpha crystallin family protein n=1 Tax=Cohnella fermenti TaxID=2565925 RepID=A0A4S4BF11_9BACL|nr:hypothetical protein [Cohnella fermenti]THF72590.1 hypothetical protein E6C55_32640 [Cohnella fermenti]
MSSFFDSGPLPDFKEIQKFLGRELPWKLLEQWDKANDNAWLNEYVNKIMQKAKSPPRSGEKAVVKAETSRGDKHVNVTLRFAPQVTPEELRLHATSERLRITGLPGGGKHVVRFPGLVYARSGRAAWNDGRLTIRFKKRPEDRQEVELFIPE